MGGYAMPSNKAFITSKPLVTKRKRGLIDINAEKYKDAYLAFDKEGNLVLMRDGEIIGVFEDAEEDG